MFKEWLEKIVGIDLYEYRPEDCVRLSRLDIIDYIKRALSKGHTSAIGSGDTHVIWIEEPDENWRELYIITRGKVYYTLPLSKDEAEKIKKTLGL